MSLLPIEESTFRALVSLLDDPDPFVTSEVEKQLFGLGLNGIERLEQIWEQTDSAIIQHRIEELIGRIQLTSLTEQLLNWRKGGGEDLLEGWLILTQIQYPTLNLQKYRNAVSSLVSRIWIHLDERMNEIEKLCVVNKYFYQIESYSGNYQEPEKPDNNYLSVLIDSKKGNSLSLSALYLTICNQLNIPLQVVNFVGYYAIRCYRRTSHFYIDAYNQGMFFTPQQVQEFLEKMNVEDKVNHYKPLSNIYIILSIIQQLIQNYQQIESPKADIFEKLLKDIEITFG
jgi:regulator of sirC expression with transglutaminase-like and TPR domain